jgi:hypothetical protein
LSACSVVDLKQLLTSASSNQKGFDPVTNLALQPNHIQLLPEEIQAVKPYEDQCILIQHIDHVGTQLVFRFLNQTGASLIILDEPDQDQPYEVAVIRFVPGDDDWLTFPENGLTDKTGLVKDLSLDQVTELIGKIQGLEQ